MLVAARYLALTIQLGPIEPRAESLASPWGPSVTATAPLYWLDGHRNGSMAVSGFDMILEFHPQALPHSPDSTSVPCQAVGLSSPRECAPPSVSMDGSARLDASPAHEGLAQAQAMRACEDDWPGRGRTYLYAMCEEMLFCRRRRTDCRPGR